MKIDAQAGSIGRGSNRFSAQLERLWAGQTLPVLVIIAAIVVLWYAGTVALNWTVASDARTRAGQSDIASEIFADTLAMERPILPAPHQVIGELWKTVVDTPISSKRSLVFHGGVTLQSALAGFLVGSLLGLGLAIAIVHVRALERSLMPWIIASQTVPILAVAPIVVVVLGSLGFTGVLPKAVISAYLCFFPVTIGMVKGLTAPDVLQRDLMRTYSGTRAQTLWKLRLPASLPYLFPSLKVAIASSLVGAIVGELPTGAQAGLGARLLSGSYYGQTTQIWAALFAAAFLASCLVWIVGWTERAVASRTGGAR
jgi:NitT/TauT family transport system permease protein